MSHAASMTQHSDRAIGSSDHENFILGELNSYKINSIFKTALSFVFVFLGACTMAPNKVQIINAENEKWRITVVSIYQANVGWLVRGKLSSPNIFGLPDGHILISVMDEDGKVIEHKEVQYQRIVGNAGRHHKHQFGRALFSTEFQSIPQDAEVVAEFKIVRKHDN